MLKKVPLVLYSIWIISFAIVAGILNSRLSQLRHTLIELENVSSELQTTSLDIQNIVNDMHNQTNELTSFQTLLNYLPQTEAHARSQKAVMDEVQSLRSKISRRLKGKLHILVDTKANILYLKQGIKLIFQADCSAGRGGVFTDKKTGRRWEFVTPQGRFRVLGKFLSPTWIKPDWAFTEEGLPIPPPDDPSRRVEGELGAYLLSLGNGYLIHGTKHEELLGHPASHGCVRLGTIPLKELYEKTPTGTEVYIY